MPFGQGRGGGGRGRGGDKKGGDKAQGQRRTLFRRRKVCKFCADKIDDINYKDVKLIGPFVPERGKILPRRISGTCAMHQRKLQTAIKRARQIGKTKGLYGSVTTVDSAEALAAKGFDVERRKLQLHEPIKQLGEVDVPVKLHRDVTAHVKVKVVAEGAQSKT